MPYYNRDPKRDHNFDNHPISYTRCPNRPFKGSRTERSLLGTEDAKGLCPEDCWEVGLRGCRVKGLGMKDLGFRK